MTTAISSLKTAVQNRIKSDVATRLSATESPNAVTCELTDDGQPTPYAGLVFISVHGGRRRNTAGVASFYRDETYYFKITTSLRSAHKHRLRVGDKVISGGDALEFITDLVIVSLDGYLALASDANTLIDSAYPDLDHQGFVNGERPVFLGSDEPRVRTASWWDAKISDQGQLAGVSQTCEFQGLRMIREIGQV